MIMGEVGSYGILNVESLMKILLVIEVAVKSLQFKPCLSEFSYKSLKYFEVSPYFVSPVEEISYVRDMAILTSSGYFKLLDAIV
jgi:hypothetical protein